MSSAGLFDAPGVGIPSLPEMIGDLMAIKPDMPSRRVVRMFKNEPELRDAVLELANSPYYSGRRPLESIGRILDRTGLPGLRSLALRGMLELELFSHSDPLIEQLRQHSTATAYITGVLARYTPLNAERLFVSALLQNIGVIIPLMNMDPQRASEPAGWQAIRYAHEAIARLACEEWDMPKEVQDILGEHHQLDASMDNARDISALFLANYIASTLDLGIDHPIHPEDDEDIVELAMEVLDVEPGQLPAIQEDAHEVLSLIG